MSKPPLIRAVAARPFSSVMATAVVGSSEAGVTHRLEQEASFTSHQLVADLAGAAGGFGIGVARAIDRDALHLCAVHNGKLIVGHVDLGEFSFRLWYSK